MSEKIKEFVEVPQQFVREGNQVRFAIVIVLYHVSEHLFRSVPCAVYKTILERFLFRVEIS